MKKDEGGRKQRGGDPADNDNTGLDYEELENIPESDDLIDRIDGLLNKVKRKEKKKEETFLDTCWC